MTGQIGALSQRALHLAARLEGAEIPQLARYLYRFGSLPRTPELQRNFGHGDDPMAVLGLTPGGAARELLEHCYEATTFPGWLSFAHDGVALADQAACKLYVSPMPAALATTFPVIASAFTQFKVPSFKIGRGIEGLLRPDKIVAYFDDIDSLNRVAKELGRRLCGCTAHPVPFTADAGGDGLLSWGIDPPLGSDGLSWRSWITRRLAEGLALDRATHGSDAVADALRHVAAQGVNASTWSIGRFADLRPSS